MKKIGFLSFGHWTPASPHVNTRSAADTLLQSIDLAVAAEELVVDGAYFRVHHFANQLSSPFPLLAAIGARTSRIEIGTGVIDMRYENPLYMAEDAGAADLAVAERVVGVASELGRQVEGHRETGRAVLDQVAVALVRVLGAREAGVLAHRPEPVAVHAVVDAARERK